MIEEQFSWLEEDMPGSEPVARMTDPGTSWAAARTVGHIRESQKRILDVLSAYGPCTDEQIAEVLSQWGIRISPSGARTRRSELVDVGLVRDSKDRMRMKSGRWAIKWEAV